MKKLRYEFNVKFQVCMESHIMQPVSCKKRNNAIKKNLLSKIQGAILCAGVAPPAREKIKVRIKLKM